MSSYADRLIFGRFNGIRPMARVLAVPKSTVSGWARRERIPDEYHQQIVTAALTLDPPVVLGPADFSNLTNPCASRAADPERSAA
jgi:hypothetical protein